MKVYVLTFGQSAYEDNVVVAGVFKKQEDALKRAIKEEGAVDYYTASYGQYYYRIEEYILE